MVCNTVKLWTVVLPLFQRKIWGVITSECRKQKKSDNNTTPTGYPSNEIDQPQIMYNDTIFYYWATGFDEELPNNYIYVGTVEEVDNETPPSENFVGSRIDVGQKIYADDKKSDTIYVEYENGYARFSLSSTQK